MRIVLLPGLDGSRICFEPFLKALVEAKVFEDVSIIRYRDNCKQTYAELESEVRSCLPHTEEFVLLGESFSGPIALSIGAMPPPNLKGIILVATFAKNPRPYLGWLRFAIPCVSLRLAPNVLINFALLGKSGTPILRRLLSDAIKTLTTQVFQTRLREVMNVNYLAQTSQITLPCLYLRASRDRLVPKQASDTLIAALRDIHCIEIDAPHFLLQVTPGIATHSIQKFVTRLTTSNLTAPLQQTVHADVS